MIKKSTRAPKISYKWKGRKLDSPTQIMQKLKNLVFTGATGAPTTPWDTLLSIIHLSSMTSAKKCSTTSIRVITQPYSLMDKQEQENHTQSKATRSKDCFKCVFRTFFSEKKKRIVKMEKQHR